MRRYLIPLIAHAVALPITLVSMFEVELAALALLAGVWFICTVLFSAGSLL